MYYIGFDSNKTALLNLKMLSPHCNRLDVAIIVFVRVEDKDIKLFFSEKAKLGGCLHSLDAYLVLCLDDVCLQIVVAKAFAREAELREGASWDLYFDNLFSTQSEVLFTYPQTL